MLLHPPGLLPYELLPHWPYARAVDQDLTERGIPPGSVRVERTGREHGETMYIVFGWDVSRTVRPGGIRLTWQEETGWSYAFLGRLGRVSPCGPLRPLHRVFSLPESIGEVADMLVRSRHTPSGSYGAEWEGADAVRAAIGAFRSGVVG
ncbi:DUF6292 family protein [Streptomyces torulosus]|uniref:DUF6292 family protein n=1 Tax=Streptomyces torulosus TaxID=68276 RepID=UPI0006EB6106|nr:DUF6292 family protein [Streptomyces torulosus]